MFLVGWGSCVAVVAGSITTGPISLFGAAISWACIWENHCDVVAFSVLRVVNFHRYVFVGASKARQEVKNWVWGMSSLGFDVVFRQEDSKFHLALVSFTPVTDNLMNTSMNFGTFNNLNLWCRFQFKVGNLNHTSKTASTVQGIV